jgi:hypothetical protein
MNTAVKEKTAASAPRPHDIPLILSLSKDHPEERLSPPKLRLQGLTRNSGA